MDSLAPSSAPEQLATAPDDLEVLNTPDRPAKARGPRPFTPRRHMIGWFDPRILALTGCQAVMAEVFGTYLDKREIEVLLGKDARIRSSAAADTVGIDYVADVGDGFDPTYAIAWHLAKDVLEVHGGSQTVHLPRGEYLIMGGDEVYPAPTRPRYLNQMVGPYAAALPGAPAGPRPQLLALPGNHDWYDGLSSFMHQFCTAPEIGGWQTPQDRSYFAIPLPHGWWLWAVDCGLGGHIDDPQKSYFRQLPVAPESRVILCWPTPTWTKERSHPGEHELLDEFVRDVVHGGHQATVPLYLSGDSHHFAHYRSADEDVHWITAGGGGAFLHPTHHLPDTITLPGDDGAETVLTLADEPWPTKRSSRRLLGRLILFPRYNPSFFMFTAGMQFLLAWAVQFGARKPDQNFAQTLYHLSFGQVWNGFVRNPFSLILALLVIGGFAAFAKPPIYGRKGYRLLGAVHGTLHVGAGLWLIHLLSQLPRQPDAGWWPLEFVAGIVVLGGLVSCELVGLYLLVTNLAGKMHDNEAFSALHHTGYKHFLRMRIDGSGLTAHVVGLESVGRRWRPEPASGQSPPCVGARDVVPRSIATLSIPNGPSTTVSATPGAPSATRLG